jgi:hypothetical protein
MSLARLTTLFAGLAISSSALAASPPTVSDVHVSYDLVQDSGDVVTFEIKKSARIKRGTEIFDAVQSVVCDFTEDDFDCEGDVSINNWQESVIVHADDDGTIFKISNGYFYDFDIMDLALQTTSPISLGLLTPEQERALWDAYWKGKRWGWVNGERVEIKLKAVDYSIFDFLR